MGAILVYVIGQLLSKFFLEPLHELRKSVGETRFVLAFHGPTIHTPIGRKEETSQAARDALLKCSCDLVSKLDAVPAYDVTRFFAFGALPNRKNLEAAAVQLRGLSTYMHETGDKANASIDAINKRVCRIENLLGVKPLE